MNNPTSINPASDDVSSQESLVDRNITNIIHLPVPERLKAIEDIWDSIVRRKSTFATNHPEGAARC